VTGNKQILNAFQMHYKKLLNSTCNVNDFKSQAVLSDVTFLPEHVITPDNVKEAVRDLKYNKAPGYDSLNAEHFKYADSKINVLLSLFFNSCMIHGYVPDSLMDTVVTPLIKDKKVI
jgi:hypothetical protein